MEVIVSIVVLVGLVLLYDFYSSRKWQLETSEIRNKIVFENRNKEYGAYVLRKSYDKTMIFILFGVMGATGVAYGVTNVWLNRKEVITKKEITTTIDPGVVEDQKEEKVEPIQKQETNVVEAKQTTTRFDIPSFTDIPTDTDILTQEQLEVVNVADENQIGFEDPFLPPVDEIKHFKIIDPLTTGGDDIVDIGLTEEPIFNAGSLQSWISTHVIYPSESIDIQEEGKVYTEFVIEKDGSVSSVKIAKSVSESLDGEALRVISLMPKWTPGKVNGKIVRSRVRLPIIFALSR